MFKMFHQCLGCIDLLTTHMNINISMVASATAVFGFVIYSVVQQ